MTSLLTRFWIKAEGDQRSPLGYGVTAWSKEDAVELLHFFVFRPTPVPLLTITENVDVSSLDAGHVLPNMHPPHWRGIWFPRGFNDHAQHQWPIKRFERPDGRENLFLVQREDGMFTLEGECEDYDDYMNETYWRPCGGWGLYLSAELAERDAMTTVPWLRDPDWAPPENI